MFTLVVERSVDLLAEKFAEHIAIPRSKMSLFERAVTPEWVITPSFGMRRWLINQTSRRLGATTASDGIVAEWSDGIVANWQNDFPSMVTSRVLDNHLKETTGLDSDPWRLPHLQFSIFQWASMDPHTHGASLVCNTAGTPILARARQLADLFDRYFTWRPEMIRAWVESRTATSMTADEHLQMAAFLGVRKSIGVPSPAERWDEAWGALEQVLPHLPAIDRCTFFGTTALPGGHRYVEAIGRLQEFVDVTMFSQVTLDSSAAVANDQLAFKFPGLRLWGAAALSNNELLNDFRALSSTTDEPSACDDPVQPPTVLSALQDSLRRDAITTVSASDASLIIHGCFGEARQAEVLRDAILHELNDEGCCEADILVVCPSLDRFAPLIKTAFGESRQSAFTPATTEEPNLAYNIVSTSAVEQGLYLQSVRHFLSLLPSRFSQSDVLSFFQEPNVRSALRFDDDSQQLHAAWVESAAIRWGLNRDHREHLDLATLGESNTWFAGLHRLTLGVMIENPGLRAADDILPVEVAPAQFGAFASFSRAVHLLVEAEREHRDVRTLAEWLTWFDHWRDLFVIATVDDAKEEERMLSALATLRDAARTISAPLTYRDFASLVLEAFEHLSSLGSILTGGITVTTPESLPAVPFKSIYILGLDDQAFIAQEWERNDLRRGSRQRGDITPTDEMRDRLRGILLQARDRITILHNAVDVVSAKRIDPGVALSELTDALQSVVAPQAWPDDKINEEPLYPFLVKHPRNAFSRRNFSSTDGYLDRARSRGIFKGPWSYSTLNYAIAQAAPAASLREHHGVPDSRPPTLDTLQLGDLVAFIKNPPKVFAQRSLGIYLGSQVPEHPDELVARFDALTKSFVVRPLLEAERATVELHKAISLAQILAHLEASGDAPPSPILPVDYIVESVESFGQAYRAAIGTSTQTSSFEQCVVEGVTIEGHLDYFKDERGARVIEVISSTVRLEKLVAAWLRAILLAATLNEPVQLLVIYAHQGRGDSRETIRTEILPIPSDAPVEEVLKDLTLLYRENLAHPLPYYVGESISNYGKQDLSEETWRNEEFGSTRDKFLGDDYWHLCFGDFTAPEMLKDYSPFGYKALLPRFRKLFANATPLFDFVERLGKDKK